METYTLPNLCFAFCAGALAFAEYLSIHLYKCEADVINPGLIIIKGLVGRMKRQDCFSSVAE